MLKRTKQRALTSLKTLGIFGLCRRSKWRRRHLLILCYHGVSLEDEHEWDPGLYMKGADFEEHLQVLDTGGFSVLSLEEGLKRLYKRDLPEASVAITIDDGHYDFVEQAYPRLAKFGFPVTVYLSTFYTTYNRPIFPGFCSYLLWKARNSIRPACKEIGLPDSIDLRSAGNRAIVWRAILDFARRNRLKAPDKDEILQRLAGHLGLSFPDLLARRILHNLNPSEVTQLAKRGVDFQLHTHRHRTPVDRELFVREIRDNRASITEMTGTNPTHFCYPSGVHRPEFLPWLAETNVTSATTCDAGMNSSHSNPLLLARILDHSLWQPVEFQGWLSGCSAWLPRRTHHAGTTD